MLSFKQNYLPWYLLSSLVKLGVGVHHMILKRQNSVINLHLLQKWESSLMCFEET